MFKGRDRESDLYYNKKVKNEAAFVAGDTRLN